MACPLIRLLGNLIILYGKSPEEKEPGSKIAFTQNCKALSREKTCIGFDQGVKTFAPGFPRGANATPAGSLFKSQ